MPKQIVDGVDVSGCEAYSKYREGYCGWYTPCSLENCQYKVNWALKQLKAKEQECERLKKEIRLYACIDKWGTEQCHCACRCLGNEFCDAAEGKMKNIKQTLVDIKEIAKKTLNMVDYKTYFKRDNKSLKQEGFKALNEILQKISEVEK